VPELEAVFERDVDKPPRVELTAAPEAPLTRAQARRVTVRWQADVDRGVRLYRYRLDDGPVAETRRAFADLSAPQPGEHTVQVQVQDHWGNWSPPATATFEVLANRRPELSFSAPGEGALVRGTGLSVELTGSDPDGRIVAWRLALDDPDRFEENTTGAFELPDPVDGPHTLFAQAIDDEGAASLWQSLPLRFRYVEPERTAPPAGAPSGADIPGFSYAGENAQGLPEYDKDLGGGVTMRFVRLPAGEFTMGSPESEEGRDGDEGPQHRVRVGSFLLARTECTQAQWRAVMGSNPSHFANAGDDAPVEQVSWEDIQAFERETGLRLPSEAEWEYAARAGSTGARHGELDAVAWHAGNAGRSTHPVGRKQANAFGLHDMLGNVWEWCEDTWHASYSGAPTDGSAWVDTGSSGRVFRVYRGGCWSYTARSCRSAYRRRCGPSYRWSALGFRPAFSLP